MKQVVWGSWVRPLKPWRLISSQMLRICRSYRHFHWTHLLNIWRLVSAVCIEHLSCLMFLPDSTFLLLGCFGLSARGAPAAFFQLWASHFWRALEWDWRLFYTLKDHLKSAAVHFVLPKIQKIKKQKHIEVLVDFWCFQRLGWLYLWDWESVESMVYPSGWGMGGGNGQKAATARARNQAKTDAEKASLAESWNESQKNVVCLCLYVLCVYMLPLSDFEIMLNVLADGVGLLVLLVDQHQIWIDQGGGGGKDGFAAQHTLPEDVVPDVRLFFWQHFLVSITFSAGSC